MRRPRWRFLPSRGRASIDLGARMLVRHRVVVVENIDVAVDADLARAMLVGLSP